MMTTDDLEEERGRRVKVTDYKSMAGSGFAKLSMAKG